MLCFRKISSEKILLDKLGRMLGKERVSRFLVEVFVSRSTERFPWGMLLCCVLEKCRSRKKLWISWEGVWGRREYHDFLSKSFLSRSTERFRWGTLLSFTNFPVSESILNKMGGGSVKIFYQNFLVHSAAKFRSLALYSNAYFGY